MPDATHSPLLPSFDGPRDAQIDALLVVLGANLNAALNEHMPQGVAVTSQGLAAWPVTLQSIVADHLPVLSIFSEAGGSHRDGKKRLVSRSFRVVWWMEPCAYDRVPKSWPLLNMAWETILATLDGRAEYDLDAPGVARRMSATSVLAGAGFQSLTESSIKHGTFFVQNTANAQVYPLLQVTFDATHFDRRGPYAYDPDTLPVLRTLAAQILEEQRRPEEQPAVRMVSTIATEAPT